MNTVANILVVEDDQDINELLCEMLTRKGYCVRGAFSGTEAKLCMDRESYQLVLLDLMLPGMTGEALIESLRKDKKMPIIVISAKPGIETKIEVLGLGADDFVSKPFDTQEVVARVEAQLRRYTQFSKVSEEHILKHKNLEVDVDGATVCMKGKELKLTAREYEILKLLMSYKKKVFTRANIFEHVWKDEFLGDDNTVNVHISNLRAKMAKVDAEEEYIQTVWGIGFKIHD